MRDCVYRICETERWAAAQASCELPLSEFDRRDGYVHLSCASQLGATLARYFAGRDDLVVLTLACERLIDGSLRYESPKRSGGDPARRPGELFPHFYGRVPVAAVVAVDPIMLDEEGRHRLPPALREAAAYELEDLEPILVRVAWDERQALVLIEYPKPARIEDEAGIYAWEAALERRLSSLVERQGRKIPAVIGIDNLWIAPKLERRYAELADKLISRWFSEVARWSTQAWQRSFFARANDARSLPSEVFDSREQAVARVLAGSPVGVGPGHRPL